MKENLKKHVALMLACVMIVTAAMPLSVFAVTPIDKVEGDTDLPVQAGKEVSGGSEGKTVTYADQVTVEGNVKTNQTYKIEWNSGTWSRDVVGSADPSVKASGDSKSVTVNGNAETKVSENGSGAYELPAVDEDVKGDQKGYSAVAAYNGGNVEISGNADLVMNFDYEDDGSGENVAISGVDADNNGNIKVGGNVNVKTGLDPYLHVKPDAEAIPFNSYESLLGHYSMGVNNEGGNVEVGKNVSVQDSHYAIGLDAGEKYVYSGNDYMAKPEYYDKLKEAFDAYMDEYTKDGKFTGSVDELINIVAKAYEKYKNTSGSAVVVEGNVDAKGGMYSKGTYTRSNGNVTVNGNITSGALNVEVSDNQAREEAVEDSDAFYNTYRVREMELEESEEYEKMTPEEQAAAIEQLRREVLAEMMARTTGVNNQGIVAQGYAGVASDDVRKDILALMKDLYPAEDYEPQQWTFDDWMFDYAECHKGLTNILPPDASGYMIEDEDLYKQLFADVMKAALAKGDRTTVKVKGDVSASDAKITKGIMALDSDVEVGGKVSSDGLAAAGIVSIGDDAAVSAGSVKSEGKNAAVGVASFGGKTNVDDEVVVSSGNDGTGIMLRAGDVTVGNDVTVNADNSTGIRTIALDNRMVTVMALNNADGEEWYDSFEDTYYAEAIWNCLNRYSDEMNVGDLLSYFINNSPAQSVVVDGTVKADNGISAVSKEDAAKLTMSYVVNMYNYRSLKSGGNPLGSDPTMMNSEDLKAAMENAESKDLRDLYRTCLALRKIGSEEAADPDVTVWRIDAKNTVNKDKETLSWKDFIDNWTFTMPDWNARTDWTDVDWGKVFNSTVEIDHSKDAERIQKGINYIIRIGSVTGGDGSISLSGTTKHNGFDTANEGDSVTVYVKCADGYRVKSVSGLYASLVSNPDGSYTLIVPEGGGVQIDAILEMIEKQKEDEEKPEAVTKAEPAKPETKAAPVQKTSYAVKSVPAGMPLGLVLSGKEMNDKNGEKALWNAMERLENADSYYSASYLASKDADEQKENIEKMAQAGYSLIFCVGDDMAAVTKEMAEKYPEQSFVLVNSGKADGKDLDSDNIANMVFTDDGKAMSSEFTDAQMDLGLGEVCTLKRNGSFDAKTRTYDAKDQSKNSVK